MRFSTIFATALVAASSVIAAPVPAHRELAVRQAVFPPTPYSTVQISDGVAGNAEAEAAAVCIEPFGDLASVDAESLKNLAILRKAAEEAESDFNDAIAAAGKDTPEGAALEIGKTKNKVLKLTCLAQVNRIKQAQGDESAAAKIADSEAKLANNVSKDVAKAGAASTGLPDSPAAAASEAEGST